MLARSLAMTGAPIRIASMSGAPNPSYVLGKTIASAMASSPLRSPPGTLPGMTTRSASPSAATAARTSGSACPAEPAKTTRSAGSDHAPPACARRRSTNRWFLCGWVIAGNTMTGPSPSPYLRRSSSPGVGASISGSRPWRTTVTFSPGVPKCSASVDFTKPVGTATCEARASERGTTVRR